MTEPHADTDTPQDTEVPAGDGEDTKKTADAAEGTATEVDELATLKAELAERTGDLQRVTAEYANYRKRVDRDRKLVADQATISVVTGLLPVLDDLDRAREHGDLTGPFGAVAEQLTASLGKLGLAAFGEKGDAFDPNRHEAVAHMLSADVSEPTCIDVLRRGYLLGDRLVRAALVAVADPAELAEPVRNAESAEPVVAKVEDAEKAADEPVEAEAEEAEAEATAKAEPADGGEAAEPAAKTVDEPAEAEPDAPGDVEADPDGPDSPEPAEDEPAPEAGEPTSEAEGEAAGAKAEAAADEKTDGK